MPRKPRPGKPSGRAPERTAPFGRKAPPKKAVQDKARRLAAYLAEAGVASRRKAEELIRRGKVSVNGRPAADPALGVVPGRDRVEVEGKAAVLPRSKSYVLLHKPRGYLSAASDSRGKPTVLDLIPALKGRRLYPVGRLDINAEGLILLTDDGRLAYRLTHPRFQVPRVYLAKVRGQPKPAALARLTRGITEQGEVLRAREAKPVRLTRSNAWIRVVLTEGKYREVRRLFEAIRHPVVKLVRIAFGPLELGRLDPGSHRSLTPEEVRKLKEIGNEAGRPD